MSVQTSVSCVAAGVFRCPLVVTMRPIPSALLDAAVKVTHLNPTAHGAPIHIGDPGLSLSLYKNMIMFVQISLMCCVLFSSTGDSGLIQT